MNEVDEGLDDDVDEREIEVEVDAEDADDGDREAGVVDAFIVVNLRPVLRESRFSQKANWSGTGCFALVCLI